MRRSRGPVYFAPMSPRHLDLISHTTPLGTWSLVRGRPAAGMTGVLEYWEVQGRLSPFREAILPNGATEVMINLGPPHRVFRGKATGRWDKSWFSGLQEKAIFVESLEGTHLISARLHPLAALRYLGPAVPGGANTVVELEALVGRSATALRRALTAARSPAERFDLLEAFLQGLHPPAITVPTFVAEAATRIERVHGKIAITTLGEGLGVSRKHLAVSFKRFVGVSAKAYASIHRFLWTLGRLRESSAVEWSRLAAEAGYSDQAHLVRDFKRVGAATPSGYLRQFAPDRDALIEDRQVARRKNGS